MPVYENPPGDSIISPGKPKRDNQIFGYPGDDVTIVKHDSQGEIYYKVIVQITGHTSFADNEWMYVQPILSGRIHDAIYVSMADFGLIPYYEDVWHQRNWCEEYLTE